PTPAHRIRVSLSTAEPFVILTHPVPQSPFLMHSPGHAPPADLGGGDSVPTGQALIGLKRAAANQATWILVFFYFLSFGGFLAFTSWLPTSKWHLLCGLCLQQHRRREPPSMT